MITSVKDTYIESTLKVFNEEDAVTSNKIEELVYSYTLF